MIFFTFEFLAFFAFVLALNWGLKSWPRLWRLFLLLSSYYFYSVSDRRLLAALAALSVFNYFIGRAIFRNSKGEKKFFLILGVIGNLQVLVFFKYYDFFRLSLETILSKLG